MRAITFAADGRALLTWTQYLPVVSDFAGPAIPMEPGVERHQLWSLPAPVPDDPSRVALWVQVITGTEFDESGTVRQLDAADWHTRRQRMKEFGGPPAP